MTAAQARVDSQIFDAAYEALLGSDIHAGMTMLRTTLRELRAQLPPERWRDLGEQARTHPVHALLLESPFTRRAYTKPRGYPGDAGLMDLIYGSPAERTLSPVGAMLYAYEFDSPCFQSVRRRRAVLAREIDEVAAQRPAGRVLAVASGHLREIEWSRAAHSTNISISAVDQDAESLAVVASTYSDLDVTTINASVRDLLRRPLWLGDIDLAYSAGLYDYLVDDVARTLTTVLFRMLGSGGRLLIGNFTPANTDAAFMEAIMDWHLIYRTPAEVRALTSGLPQGDIAALDQFVDENGHVAYLRLVKR